eukprot:TRINITY_DN457_c1_g1_i1.p1 TRINITY_DN457_c1_g1~~TRINITY_DN457_c1_g1_i1.p1  ORF type:complete len:164 (-),score=21.74 TRINITY_DN457_c1_g1_i1:87-578(-)
MSKSQNSYMEPLLQHDEVDNINQFVAQEQTDDFVLESPFQTDNKISPIRLSSSSMTRQNSWSLLTRMVKKQQSKRSVSEEILSGNTSQQLLSKSSSVDIGSRGQRTVSCQWISANEKKDRKQQNLIDDEFEKVGDQKVLHGSPGRGDGVAMLHIYRKKQQSLI